MTNFLRSLRYLEHAITVAAFAEDDGRKALEHPTSSDDLVEVALRHASAAQRNEYVKAAEPLVACGVPEVEARAKHIITLAKQRGRRWWRRSKKTKG